jgi:hypothetical protein
MGVERAGFANKKTGWAGRKDGVVKWEINRREERHGKE